MLQFVLLLFTALHPNALHIGDAKSLANAIAYVAEHDEPIEGLTRNATAAILAVTAWDESRFQMGSVGDHGQAFCAMQVHGGSWLARDPLGCVRSALHVMRISAKTCPDAPLAAYAGGCHYRAARGISARRLMEAERIERVAQTAQ